MSDRAVGRADPADTGAAEVPTVQVFVVPLDGSEFAERAVPVAARLARTVGAELHLLGVVDQEEEVAQREADLDAAAGTYDRVQRSVVVDADPAGAIHRHVEELGHAVICMASHGRGRSAGVVGSVANEVIARSRESFVIVGPRIDDVAPWVPEGSARSAVVACVDETPASTSVPQAARAWAALLSEPMIVVTVAEPVPPSVAGVPDHRRFGPDGDVEAFLSSVTDALGAASTGVTTHVVWDPISPAEGMRAYLREHPAALVVVGSRARHGLARVVFGSVAAGIVHASPSPVLVVPPRST
jgi:nucleotide-binding universal stress UspA family protein